MKKSPHIRVIVPLIELSCAVIGALHAIRVQGRCQDIELAGSFTKHCTLLRELKPLLDSVNNQTRLLAFIFIWLVELTKTSTIILA